jgi:hypothetical protein
MLYIINDILLKLALNTNKDGDHAMRNSRHIVESHDMVTSVIGTCLRPFSKICQLLRMT